MAQNQIPLYPPIEWFSPPADGIPTDKRITIEPEGRAYGYVALWNTCHSGLNGCTRPPKGSPTNYEQAHAGETITASGESIRTAVIGGGAGHAPLNHNDVVKFYDNSGTQMLRVRYGEDENGLWFAGALWPDVSELDVARIRASGISGDWRWHAAWRRSAGAYEFMGACLVNIEGYPMDKPGSIKHLPGGPQALAASFFILDGEEVIEVQDPHAITAGALPFVASPKADEDMAWNGPETVAQADNREDLRRIHAWVDPDGNPDAKSSYKLPHHLLDGRVVMNGVEAAMGALLGARGGTQIPESDRRAVYEHLAAHYRQFDKEPPEFRIRASAINEGEEPVECDGKCSECTCGKKETEANDDVTHDEIVAALAYSVNKRRKKKMTASAEVEDETETETETVSISKDMYESLVNRVEALEGVARDVEAEKLLSQLESELSDF